MKCKDTLSISVFKKSVHFDGFIPNLETILRQTVFLLLCQLSRQCTYASAYLDGLQFFSAVALLLDCLHSDLDSFCLSIFLKYFIFLCYKLNHFFSCTFSQIEGPKCSLRCSREFCVFTL